MIFAGLILVLLLAVVMAVPRRHRMQPTVGIKTLRVFGASLIAAATVVVTIGLTIGVIFLINGNDCGDLCGLGYLFGLYIGGPLSLLTAPFVVFLYWRYTGAETTPPANRPAQPRS